MCHNENIRECFSKRKRKEENVFILYNWVRRKVNLKFDSLIFSFLFMGRFFFLVLSAFVFWIRPTKPTKTSNPTAAITSAHSLPSPDPHTNNSYPHPRHERSYKKLNIFPSFFNPTAQIPRFPAQEDLSPPSNYHLRDSPLLKPSLCALGQTKYI